METYPPTFLSSSSHPPPPPPFTAMMNTSSHHRADSKAIDNDEELVTSSGGWFLGLTPPQSTGSHRAPTTSSDNIVVEGSAGGHDSRDKSSVFEGSGIGEPGMGKKGDAETTKGKARKQRYAFQTRSQVDILDDEYRWRKYGQKAVKNNKFPRSYYRCTVQGCNVKKQVQRLTGDEGIVVTTYEGMHSHPIEKSTDNFEHILGQFRIYTST